MGGSAAEPVRVVIHIGMEKTGSTAIQAHLAARRGALRRAGLRYPLPLFSLGPPSHQALAASFLPRHDDFALGARPRGRERLLRHLLAGIDRDPAATTILSAEHFSSRFAPPEIAALRAALGGRRTAILALVRDHRAMLLSAYATHILSGGVVPLGAFVDDALAPGNRMIRHAATLRLWERIFGCDALRVLPCREGEDAVALFLGALPAAVPAPGPAAPRRNRSLGPVRTEALRRFNASIAPCGPPGDYPGWRRARCLRAEAVRCLRAMALAGPEPPWTLDGADAARVEGVAAADRAELAARFGAELAVPPPPTAGATGAAVAQAGAALAAELGTLFGAPSPARARARLFSALGGGAEAVGRFLAP